MDPVSVFNALHDTKCIKFGRYDLKSGLVAPYYINLRRLPLYPALMEAVVTQVVEKFLTKQALMVTMSQVRKSSHLRSNSSAARLIKQTSLINSIKQEFSETMQLGDKAAELTDSDSQLGEEDCETSSEDNEWDALKSMLEAQAMDPIISGVPYGAVPIAAAIAFKARLPYLFERKETKLHGDHQPLIEDFNPETRNVYPVNEVEQEPNESTKEQQVVLVEDVICSGESILEAVKQLEQQKLKVEFVVCIIDREENGVKLLLEQAGIHVLSLYKISAILRVLEATGRITSNQFITTRKWIDENQFHAIGVDPSQAPATPTPQSTTTNHLVKVTAT